MSSQSRVARSLCCMMSFAAVTSPAAAGELPRFDPLPVAFRDVPELIARPGDGEGGGSEGGVAACDQSVVTWSGANFAGGAFTLQAGFAQGEIAAASFAVPANQFPVRIDLAEIIFATSNTVVTTTTHWTVLFWEGTPATGQLKASFSSDGKILPHIVIPPGTNGVNLNFLVDPGDPEQIILDNNGSGIISVGFRVDKHNNGPANPCNSIPVNSNAFPTTDTNGLQAATNNWLFVINCPGLCPAGWYSFNQLNVFCRPTGDWNIRLTYTGLGCAPPAPGGCCLPSGVCAIQYPADCTALGGTFLGPNTTCVNANCVPTGNVPCCFASTGNCIVLSYGNCVAAGGVPGPVGVSCQNYTCFPKGACCKPDGTCEFVSPEACAAANGLYQGNNVTCAQVQCPAPTGASCFPNGFCLELTEADANAVGAVWKGAGTTCVDSDNNGSADLCESGPPCGVADFNCDGVVDGDDLGTLLGYWGPCLQPCPADLNGDGVVDGNDLGTLLGLWG